MAEHHKPGRTLDQRLRHRITVINEVEIALLMPEHGPIVILRLTIGRYHHVIADAMAAPTNPRTLISIGPADPQSILDLAFKLTFGLDFQRLINRFVTHSHCLIVRILTHLSLTDLLGRPTHVEHSLHKIAQPRAIGQSCLLGRFLDPAVNH